MKDEYYAHSRSETPKEDWHRLEDHLKEVAEVAWVFANDFNAGDWGDMVGLSCDKENSIIGKGYSYGQEALL